MYSRKEAKVERSRLRSYAIANNKFPPIWYKTIFSVQRQLARSDVTYSFLEDEDKLALINGTLSVNKYLNGGGTGEGGDDTLHFGDIGDPTTLLVLGGLAIGAIFFITKK